MTLRPSVGSISLLWAVCWRINSDLGLILQEASPDLQDQMLTLGHVPECVICEHVFIFWDLDNKLMDCKHPTVIKSFMNFYHRIQPSALLLCSANFYWSTCIEKYTHSFIHMIHQQVQVQHTLNIRCLDRASVQADQQIFPELVEHLVTLSADVWSFHVIRILKTLGEQHGDVCTEDSEASCPLQRNQQTVSHLSSPAASSRSFQHLKVSVKHSLSSGWNRVEICHYKHQKSSTCWLSLLCLSLALSCDEFYRCKSLKNIQLQFDWDYFQRRTDSHSVFWGVLVCFVQSHRLFVGV